MTNADLLGATVFEPENTPAERPIIFSTEMVKAILNGTKTQTRRIVKMPKDGISEANWGFTAFTPENHISLRAKHANGEFGESFVKSPYGMPGDLLWVRETFCHEYIMGIIRPFIRFRSDTEPIYHKGYKWKPSIHMPKSYAQIWLEIESISVEPLNNISEQDAIAEGIEVIGETIMDTPLYRDYLKPKEHRITGCNECIESFKTLWQSIKGKDSWVEKPFVWVVKFKVISITGK